MRKTIYILIGLIILLIAGYYVVKIYDGKTGDSIKNQKSTYIKSELGLQFKYPVGPKGYVVDERIPADIGDLVRVIILQRTEDVGKPAPVGGEGAPTITISVFNNQKKQSSRNWADANIQYSNINLLSGTVSEAVVGGANAVRYMADGLYASENVVVAHGDNVYVVTGQFMDANSDLRLDFAPIIDSIQFIPKPEQE